MILRKNAATLATGLASQIFGCARPFPQRCSRGAKALASDLNEWRQFETRKSQKHVAAFFAGDF